MTTIRPGLSQDIPALATIYAHHVRHGTGTFEIDPPTENEMLARQAEVASRGLPYLVLEVRGQVLGFAYCNWFKPRPAYRFSAEDSIYLNPEHHGKGYGRLLLAELASQAQGAGIRKLIAVIGDSANASSIGVHRALGFTQVGVLQACGWKFERWLDVVLMEKNLGPGNRAKPQA